MSLNDILNNKCKLVCVLIIILVIFIIIMIAIILIIKFCGKNKISEKFSAITGNSDILNYVDSWISNIYQAYSANSIMKNESFAQPRTNRSFSNINYLEQDPIKTGVAKY